MSFCSHKNWTHHDGFLRSDVSFCCIAKTMQQVFAIQQKKTDQVSALKNSDAVVKENFRSSSGECEPDLLEQKQILTVLLFLVGVHTRSVYCVKLGVCDRRVANKTWYAEHTSSPKPDPKLKKNGPYRSYYFVGVHTRSVYCVKLGVYDRRVANKTWYAEHTSSPEPDPKLKKERSLPFFLFWSE